MTRPAATLDSLEAREEYSLTRIKEFVRTATAIVADKGGKGVHKGIQEAIRGVERELAVLKDYRWRIRVAKAEAAEPQREDSTAAPERLPAKRPRTEATPEKAASPPAPAAEETAVQGAISLVLAALGKVQSDLLEQGKSIAGLTAENRRLRELLDRPLSSQLQQQQQQQLQQRQQRKKTPQQKQLLQQKQQQQRQQQQQQHQRK